MQIKNFIKYTSDGAKTLVPVVHVGARRLIRGCKNKIIHPRKESLKKEECLYNSFYHYSTQIHSILSSKDLENVSRYVESLFKSYLRQLKGSKDDGYLNDELHQTDIFNRILFFLNNLYRNRGLSYIYNTLSKNDVDEFSKLDSIGTQVNNFVGKIWESGVGVNSGGCCIHYALILDHFFSELEKCFENLKRKDSPVLSHEIFIEKTNGVIHAGIRIKFQNTYYIADTSGFNGKLIQPISELKGSDQERMKDLPTMNISKTPVDDFNNSKDNYHKIIVQGKEDLVNVLSQGTKKPSFLVRMLPGMSEDKINNLIGIHIRFFNDGILLGHTFFYKFKVPFTKEDLEKIEDDKLNQAILDNLDYKIQEGHQSNIKIFPIEVKYLTRVLAEIYPRINPEILRKGLSDENNKYNS